MRMICNSILDSKWNTIIGRGILIARLREWIEPQANGCHRWTGRPTDGGYARIKRSGINYQVHRVLYEIKIGPIPEGLTLDHTCRNRWCVNPFHCEPVTNHENILRGQWVSANRVLCLAGLHDITIPGAIYVDSEGYERCHACRVESKRQYRLRLAA